MTLLRTPTPAELEELVRRTVEWASSDEGQRQICDAMADAEKTIAELNKQQRIDPARLREPVTI